MKQRLMELYFTEGGDLTDREVLIQAAADCGLDPTQVRELLATDQDIEEITKAAEAASNAGSRACPSSSSVANSACPARSRRSILRPRLCRPLRA